MLRILVSYSGTERNNWTVVVHRKTSYSRELRFLFMFLNEIENGLMKNIEYDSLCP